MHTKYMWKCNLKSLMAEKQLTQRELSDKTGIATTTIGRLSNNHFSMVRTETLNKLAEYFEIKDGSKLFELVIED